MLFMTCRPANARHTRRVTRHNARSWWYWRVSSLQNRKPRATK